MPREAKKFGPMERSARRPPLVSLTLSLLAVFIFLLPSGAEWFQFDLNTMQSGQWWRIVTCQWTHWNFSHISWDLLMFLVLGVICERLHRASFMACIAVGAVLIPLASMAASPELQYYRGLSGLDSALFVLLAVRVIHMYRRQDRLVTLAATVGLGAFALKTSYECATGAIIFVQADSSFTPVPFAHLVGGIIGIVVACLIPSDGFSNHESKWSLTKPTCHAFGTSK